MIKKIVAYARLILHSFGNYVVRCFLMNFPAHWLRAMIMRLSCRSFGDNSSVLLGVEFRKPKNITIGMNSIINKKVLLDGRGGHLKIGDNVDIAQETNIWTLEHDVHDDYHIDTGADVTIEDFVWIASRVTILPGVVIGRGAVVASNSVVTKDIPPMAIYGGIPAKQIGTRKSGLKYKLNYKPWFQ